MPQNDKDNACKEGYEAEIMDHYCTIIHDCVGYELTSIPNVKNIQVSAPEKYSGEDNIEKFDAWLAGLLRWFQVYNITGQEKYLLRVDLCGTTLSSLTAVWYADRVEVWN
jgi:hypothetical protein